MEAAFATLIVGMMLVAAMSTAGASGAAQRRAADRGRGSLLGQALMSEIVLQAYVNPNGNVSNATIPPTRTNFNNVDDYNGWSESPPQNKDGSTISNFAGWGRSVSVSWVNTSNLTTTASSDTGVKRITITVTKNNAVVATLVAIRSNHP